MISEAVVNSDSDARAWLADFEARHGRPLRVLHVGNIANNAYNNAKIQRAFGVEAHVVAPNYYHVMGCPEWEDAEIEGTIADPFFPDFWSLNLKGFRRPRWFVQGPLEQCRRYLLHLTDGQQPAAGLIWTYLQAYRYQLVKPWLKAHSKRFMLMPIMRRFTEFAERVTSRTHILALEAQIEAVKALAFALSAAEFRARHAIREDDYVYFHGAALEWLPLFQRYDIIQAYSTDPIWPFLCQLPNFVAYEHGTIREIPFQDTNIGRMTAAAYRAAPAVFITNVDNIRGADRLGLSGEQRWYLPHAFDYRKLLAHAAASSARPDPAAKPQVFMPSRQDWVVRDPNWAKGNDVVIRALPLLRERGVDFVMKFVDWGKDVGSSRALIQELGVTDMVVWSSLLTKRMLWDEYLRSAAVIDQFLLPGISGVSFEAMTLGKPVITCDEPGLNATFFGQAPPLLAANTPEQVANQIERVVLDQAWRDRQARESARWIAEYHSSERIFEIQINAFRKVLEQQSRQ